MRCYPEYKESGVEWIGEIPVHSEVKRLKYVADLNMGQSPPSEEYNSDQLGTPFLQGNAEFGLHHPTPKIYCPTAKKHASPGEILVSVRAPVGAINIADQEYGIGRGLCAIRPRTNQLERHYAKYLLEVVRTELHVVATGSTYDAVTVDEVSNLTCVVPPLSEQCAIANFLDRKTGQIVELIRIKGRRIELLQEQRTALINQAVTKGLDPNVEIKPSGVDWIGEICKHWEIKKLKYIVQGGLTNGLFKKKDQFGSGVKLINVTDMYQDEFLVKFEKLDRVEAEPREIETYAVEPGDIFFVRSSLKLEGVAASACITDVPEPTVFECHLVRLHPCPTQVLFKYLINYLNSTQTRQRLITLANTVTMTTIAQPKLASIEVVLPSLSEQHAIIDYLDKKTQQIHELIAAEGRKIELLKEYRQSLISEVVTGKIDVRSEV